MRRSPRADRRTTKERGIRHIRRCARTNLHAHAPPDEGATNEGEADQNGSDHIWRHTRATCMHPRKTRRRRKGLDQYGPGSAI